ncbi:MAG: hypothetical protein JWQ03_607 [Variovorax sp.]|nr:hypothetical protein [Variovorax sp.]
MRDEWNAVVRLAIARYPMMPPELALECFHSDRRAAGLGALDERKREPTDARTVRRPVTRLKVADALSRRVEYRLARESYQAFTGTCLLDPRFAREATFTKVTVKGYDYAVFFDDRELATQRGRDVIARQLRAIRRQVEKDAKHAQQ